MRALGYWTGACAEGLVQAWRGNHALLAGFWALVLAIELWVLVLCLGSWR
jgi:hypothetical protein